MATYLITEIPVFAFSYELQEIELYTDLGSVMITIEDGAKEFFRTTLYSYNAKVTIINIAEVLENYMRNNNQVFTAFNVYYRDADESELGSFNLNTLYCTHSIKAVAGEYASKHFLTTLSAKRVPRDSTEFLSLLHGQEMGNILAHCVFVSKEGTIETATVTLKRVTTDDIGVMTFSVSEYQVLLLTLLSGKYPQKILSYTVEFNGRFFTYYIADFVPEVKFTFRNCFNVEDTAYFDAITTSKTKVNRSLAIAKGQYSFYDQSVEKSYEVQSAPLTQEEAEWVEQLFISHSVRLGTSTVVDNLPEVIITDMTCEVADNDEELNQVKFTWQYVDKRPHLPAPPTESEVFTDEFNQVFS